MWPNAKKLFLLSFRVILMPKYLTLILCNRFTIQLLGSAKDVALSIDFIYNGDEKLVVRSCLVNGQLKKRECDVFESTPKREDVFEVILLVTSSVFKVSLFYSVEMLF